MASAIECGKERIVSEQAPPKVVKKEKPDAIPLPDQKKEKIKKIEEKKQNPEKIDSEIKQVSEFEQDWDWRQLLPVEKNYQLFRLLLPLRS